MTVGRNALGEGSILTIALARARGPGSRGGSRRGVRGGPRRRRRGRGGQAGRAGGASREPVISGGPWSAGCSRGSPTWPTWWRRESARRIVRASCTDSTRARRGCSRWPGPRRPTAPWWRSWPIAAWSVATWPWSRASVADDRGEIDAPIGRSTRTPTKMADLGRGSGGPHRLHGAGTPRPPPSEDAGGAEPAERADPPDPRPHGGHRPPRGG